MVTNFFRKSVLKPRYKQLLYTRCFLERVARKSSF